MTTDVDNPPPPSAGSVQVPLVVDLDGTLIRSDLLHETASLYLLRGPHRLFSVARWTVAGKARLKSELAGRSTIEFHNLPYREELVDWLRAERATGRRLVLATASDATLAQGVADHLGMFDEVLASDGSFNLRGTNKRDRLIELYGEDGFDYVGDTDADVPVWSACRIAHVVNDDDIVERAASVATVGQVFPDDRRPVLAMLKALRPHQWVKNALVLLPLFTAQVYNQTDKVIAAIVAAMCFSIAASSVYILNDIADVGNDRHHPIKRNRPFASGQASLLAGWFLWPLIGLIAIAGALFVNWWFVITLVTYLALTMAYTFWGKRRPVIDVVSLGLLYTVRIIAGAAAIKAPLSIWLLTFSLLFFFSLALVKRVSELTRARAELKESPGRGYRTSDLELLSSYGVASSIGAVVIFSLYVNDPATSDLYARPEVLWATVPVLLVWLMRCWLIAHRGEMDEDPIVFAIKDRASLGFGVIVAAAFLLARINW